MRPAGTFSSVKRPSRSVVAPIKGSLPIRSTVAPIKGWRVSASTMAPRTDWVCTCAASAPVRAMSIMTIDARRLAECMGICGCFPCDKDHL